MGSFIAKIVSPITAITPTYGFQSYRQTYVNFGFIFLVRGTSYMHVTRKGTQFKQVWEPCVSASQSKDLWLTCWAIHCTREHDRVYHADIVINEKAEPKLRITNKHQWIVKSTSLQRLDCRKSNSLPSSCRRRRRTIKHFNSLAMQLFVFKMKNPSGQTQEYPLNATWLAAGRQSPSQRSAHWFSPATNHIRQSVGRIENIIYNIIIDRSRNAAIYQYRPYTSAGYRMAIKFKV